MAHAPTLIEPGPVGAHWATKAAVALAFVSPLLWYVPAVWHAPSAWLFVVLLLAPSFVFVLAVLAYRARRQHLGWAAAFVTLGASLIAIARSPEPELRDCDAEMAVCDMSDLACRAEVTRQRSACEAANGRLQRAWVPTAEQ